MLNNVPPIGAPNEEVTPTATEAANICLFKRMIVFDILKESYLG